MKHSLITLIVLLLASAASAGLAEMEKTRDDSTERKTLSVKARSLVNRGPNNTLSVNTEGLGLTFQEGKIGASWAELTTAGITVKAQAVKLTASPSVQLTSAGQVGVGASLDLQLSGVLRVNHRSHLGGIENHRTTATLAPNSVVSLQYQRLATKNGVEARLGPSLKLGSKMSLWHGRGLEGASNLTVITGNLRF